MRTPWPTPGEDPIERNDTIASITRSLALSVRAYLVSDSDEKRKKIRRQQNILLDRWNRLR